MYYLVNAPDGSQVVFQADKKQVKELMQPIKVWYALPTSRGHVIGHDPHRRLPGWPGR
jgi:hypothetical protein